MTTGVAPRSFATPADAIQDLAMAAVHAVEVAERQDRVRPARRARIVRKVNDVHGPGERITADWSLGDLQNQPIIGQLHARRQARAGLGMRQVVADVREVGPVGRQCDRPRPAPRAR